MKKYKDINVYEASKERVAYIFDEFDNILIAFSGGKDSGICLNLFYDYAKETNQLHKLNFYHQDYEAGYNYTREYCLREFENKSDVARRFWCPERQIWRIYILDTEKRLKNSKRNRLRKSNIYS